MTTKKIVYVGIDVDDKAFHGAGLSLETGEFVQFKCKPDFGVLRKKLEKLFPTDEIRLCYEACHIGYPLCRSLNSAGIHCDIIAPSLIPSKPGKRVKNDRLDALKLAEFYAKGLLTPIYIPSEEDEEIRDLLRSRGFLVKQRKMLKTHILSACKRYDIFFLKETGHKTNWTDTHISWLKKRAKELNREVCRIDIEMLLAQFTSLTESIDKLEAVVIRVSESDPYKKVNDALVSFRGISTITAMTLISELGDIRRFPHPKQLTAYCGLDIAEYSSGGKQNKKGITKTGNKHIRTILTESCQLALNPPVLSKRLRKLREGQPQEVIDIADRCMGRLHKKSTRMLYAGKHKNKIKTAAAREMLGFIWEVMKLATLKAQ
jgi:transposase